MKNLRKLAEEKTRTDPSKQQEALLPEQAQKVLHELRVHQIELEMQNEELRQAQAELEASRARYFDLYDLAPVGYFTLSKQGLILEANLTAAKLLGVKRGTLVRRPLTHFIHLADDDIYNEHCKRLFKTGKPQVFELRLVKHDGSQFWARLETSAAKRADNAPVCRAVIINITDRKLAEEALQQAYNETEQKVEWRTRELQRANRALLMLKECDEARLRACSESELLDSVCRITVEIGEAQSAWVGFPEQDEEKTVRPVAGAGEAGDNLKKIRVTWATNENGRGPVGAAIRKGLVNVCRDTASDPYLALGYAASIALPLIGESRCFGVLAIYSAQAEAFNDEEVKLLKQLADDLAFGVIALRSRAERERLQQELLKISEREKQLIAQELPGVNKPSPPQADGVFQNTPPLNHTPQAAGN